MGAALAARHGDGWPACRHGVGDGLGGQVPPPPSDGPTAVGILAYVMPAAMRVVGDGAGDVRVAA
jgi:hypothetical protein